MGQLLLRRALACDRRLLEGLVRLKTQRQQTG
jgi:hypothetical protein